jgi:hypothetical protein
MNKEQEDLSSKKTDGSLWTPSQTEQSFMQKEVQRCHLHAASDHESGHKRLGSVLSSTVSATASGNSSRTPLRSGFTGKRAAKDITYRLRVALAERNADGSGLQERDQTWENTSDRSENVRSITEAVRKDFGRDDLILVTSNGLPF